MHYTVVLVALAGIASAQDHSAIMINLITMNSPCYEIAAENEIAPYTKCRGCSSSRSVCTKSFNVAKSFSDPDVNSGYRCTDVPSQCLSALSVTGGGGGGGSVRATPSPQRFTPAPRRTSPPRRTDPSPPRRTPAPRTPAPSRPSPSGGGGTCSKASSSDALPFKPRPQRGSCSSQRRVYARTWDGSKCDYILDGRSKMIIYSCNEKKSEMAAKGVFATVSECTSACNAGASPAPSSGGSSGSCNAARGCKASWKDGRKRSGKDGCMTGSRVRDGKKVVYGFIGGRCSAKYFYGCVRDRAVSSRLLPRYFPNMFSSRSVCERSCCVSRSTTRRRG